MIKKLALFILIPFLFLSSCSKKTEREQYESMTSGLKYKAYKKLSREAIPPLMKVYNESLQGTEKEGYQLQESYVVHLILGYAWAVSGKPAFAFAESELVSQSSQAPEVQFLSVYLNSMIMGQQGWVGLSQEELKKADSYSSSKLEAEKLKLNLMIFHLVLGSVHIQHKNFDAALFHFKNFSIVSGVNFPLQLVEIMRDVEKGDIKNALINAKKLSENPEIPEPLRLELKKSIKQIEDKAGPADSMLFWPKLVGAVVLEKLSQSSDAQIKKIMNELDSVKKKLTL